jgi:hypothetical protein
MDEQCLDSDTLYLFAVAVRTSPLHVKMKELIAIEIQSEKPLSGFLVLAAHVQTHFDAIKPSLLGDVCEEPTEWHNSVFCSSW